MAKTIRGKDGFTIIELLIAILIIGVLASIALPSFLGQQDKGKAAGAKSYIDVSYQVLKTNAVDRLSFNYSVAEATTLINASEGNNYAIAGVAPINGSNRVGIISSTGPAVTITGIQNGFSCTATVTYSGVVYSGGSCSNP